MNSTISPKTPYELNNLVADARYAKVGRALRSIIIEELRQERGVRARMSPPSSLEYQLVDSTPSWPRQEMMLLYKLEQLEAG